jgi:uncharacterized phage infection (PIP) family protein YhgE
MRLACRVFAISLLAVFVLSGCGGGDGGSGSTSSTSDWADGLCSAIGDWTDSASSATASLTSGNLDEAGLRSAVEDLESATSTFVGDVKALGTPDTEAGQNAKESLDQLADNLDSELAEIKTASDNASGVSGALAAVSTISGTLSTMSQQISSTFSELQQLDAQGELERAFEESDSCASLGSGS